MSTQTPVTTFNNVCNVWPLIETKYKNPIQDYKLSSGGFDSVDLKDCGLRCNESKLLYGLSDTDQELIDIFKISCGIICFITILYIFINRILEERFSNQKFWNKPLLYHCPYFISGSVFAIMVLMNIGQVIGKDEIVCNQDKSMSCSYVYRYHSVYVCCM